MNVKGPDPFISRGPVLVLGAAGMLGRAWRALLDREGVGSRLLDLPEFDITRPEQVAAAVTGDFPLVVNCAAWTDVDGAEAHEAEAAAVNAAAVELLARRCRGTGATLVHYSTDFVFDGESREPYRPEDRPNPVSAYGRTKLSGERLLTASGCRHLLVRTSWLYAPWCRNFVAAIAGAARGRPALRVVADQTGRPSSAEVLAGTTWKLLASGAEGLWHATDGGAPCTRFAMAGRIAAAVNPACRVEPCTSAEFPGPARRPAWSVLDISRTEELLGPLPDWRESLDAAVRRMGAEGSGAG
jgi:dTDP-4-dehydrorhamnose reductase